MLPTLIKVIGRAGRLIEEVLVEAGGDAADDVRPASGGPHLAWVQQRAPTDVDDPGEEGVHLGRPLPPSRRDFGVGGGLGGGGRGLCPTPGPSSPAPRRGACRRPSGSPWKRVRWRRGRRC